MKLTLESARELLPGQTLKDHAVKGLELRARAGVKSWHVYYRAACGSQRRPKLGAFPTLSLQDARELARDMLRKVAAGDDPSRARAEYRAAADVSALCDLYAQGHMLTKAKLSQEQDARNIRLYVQPLLGTCKLIDVTGDHIKRALAKVAKDAGPVASNRVRALLSKLFRIAIDDKLRADPVNPVRASKLNPERRRKRKIEPHEFEAIAKALDEYEQLEPRHVAAIRCILYCGSRITELVTARGAELQGNRVVLRHHKTERTGEAREIVLPTQVIEIIQSLAKIDDGYLFGADMTRFAVYRVWKKVRARAGCNDLRLQDLRRTFASMGRSTGHDLGTVSDLFDHKHPSTTKRYAYLYEHRKDSAAQDIADALIARLTPNDEAK